MGDGIAEKDVERRGEEVEVFRVRQVNEETQHDDHVQPPHGGGERLGRALGMLAKAAASRPPNGAQTVPGLPSATSRKAEPKSMVSISSR